jgi:NAD(P)-dependent dehydrogenase (short-subunit alcohol dehydrogenase family)
VDLQLSGKRALVTGSNSGIGAAIARTLAAEGASVVIHGRNAERCQTVAGEITAVGGKALVATGDVATEAGCQAVGDAVMSAWGGIDILVNNAGGRASNNRPASEGGPPNASWLEGPWSAWMWTFEQNLGAAVRLIQRFVPGMKERRSGRVINIASAVATQTEPDLADYQAAKAAMVNMSASLARTLAHTGITVNTVTPGPILTPAMIRMWTGIARQKGWSTDNWKEIESRVITEMLPISAERLGQPEDIGRMVALLASPLSGYMTGANYRVDGGQIRSIN